MNHKDYQWLAVTASLVARNNPDSTDEECILEALWHVLGEDKYTDLMSSVHNLRNQSAQSRQT